MMMDDGLQIDDAHGDGSEVDDVITPPPPPHPPNQSLKTAETCQNPMLIKVRVSINWPYLTLPDLKTKP